MSLAMYVIGGIGSFLLGAEQKPHPKLQDLILTSRHYGFPLPYALCSLEAKVVTKRTRTPAHVSSARYIVCKLPMNAEAPPCLAAKVQRVGLALLFALQSFAAVPFFLYK